MSVKCLALVIFVVTTLAPDSLFADLDQGLIAYYPFDGDVLDHSGKGNDGTNHGATFSDDVPPALEACAGQSICFDGVGDHIVLDTPLPVNGGDYTIAGRQPPNTTINFWGGARSLTVNADAAVNVGGLPPNQDLGLALSMHAAMKLDLGDLEILIGAGAQAHGLSVR